MRHVLIRSTFCVFSTEDDVTGSSTLKPREELVTCHQTLLEQIKSWNPCFSTLEGNPHSEVVSDEE